MAVKTGIKVIKRDDRNRHQKKSAEVKPARPTAREAAREMVSNVTNWVAEFQERRREETSQALKTMFPERPQTSGA